MQPVVRIVRPAGRGGETLLPQNCKILEDSGLRILREKPMSEDHWPYTASSPQSRLNNLADALCERGSHIILCARGGYGASDLLPFLPWDRLKSTPHKWLVGFSDITALQWALYSGLGWPSLHGPMPASTLWGQAGETRDIENLINILRSPIKEGSVRVTAINKAAQEKTVQGTLLGGCLSVICSLSGTRYFPKSLQDHILFFEDTGENPGRLMRHWNQLLQNGSIQQATGVLLGRFSGHDSDLSEDTIRREIAARSPVPCWMSNDFGHTSPNFPLVNGSQGNIKSDPKVLHWKFTRNGESGEKSVYDETKTKAQGHNNAASGHS